MIKKYFQILVLIFWFCITTFSFSQITEINDPKNIHIEGLTIYPNPVSNGKLYISSTKNLSKHIEIFDVLGKQVINETVDNNRLDVSILTNGIYIMKISQGNATTTKKLVIK